MANLYENAKAVVKQVATENKKGPLDNIAPLDETLSVTITPNPPLKCHEIKH